MPEIWLNYGHTNTILDIMVENLDQEIKLQPKKMEEDIIDEKLASLDISKPFEIVVLNATVPVYKIINKLFLSCEERTLPIPKILADKNNVPILKKMLVEGSLVLEFDYKELKSNLIFLAEIELDGLLGFETVSTRLTKKYNQDIIKEIFNKQQKNSPSPGKYNSSMGIVKKFIDGFEIMSIEVAAVQDSIIDIHVGHPSRIDIIPQYAKIISKKTQSSDIVIASTGKYSSNDTLNKTLQTAWNCLESVNRDGLLILVGEATCGLGSMALQQFVEDRLDVNDLIRTSEYVQGLENCLYLRDIQKKNQDWSSVDLA